MLKRTIKSALLVSLSVIGSAAMAQTVQPWMSPEVGSAWSQGYRGQGTQLIIVDDFNSASGISGTLDGTVKTLRHGEWTRDQASIVAPLAQRSTIDFTQSGSAITLAPGLDIVNASYGLMAQSGMSVSRINFGTLHNSVINSAKNGTAVVVKAAGNQGIALNGSLNNQTDYMNLALVGAPSAIYVGALNKNGTTASKASIASYSNRAGSNTTIQKQFLMVGVEGNKTGLYGTSFAAPIVSGYASILGSKFSTATPTQIKNQLLNTARTDTIVGYKASVHGRGEASIARALAPVAIK